MLLAAPATPHLDADRLACLRALERKVLWLSTWMIHHANHLRAHPDGLKVGGHQASSASVVTLLTALYLDTLRPEDRVAVKPHASPVFHALQYLLGRQPREHLERFRALGGAQAYPSRTKDVDGVDFSTGSVGLGVAITLFASLVQDYVRLKGLAPAERPAGRLVAVLGDAELDEGNVFEAMLEGWKHDVRNLWWIVDYNRQSLDAFVADRLFARMDDIFRTTGFRVVVLKYGKRLEAAFLRPGGDALRAWIDECSNSRYAALTYKGGPAWRRALHDDLGHLPGIRALLEELDDAGLHTLMTNLAGHDMASVLEAFRSVTDDAPTCFLAYTIKGYGLPLAGHKDNHAGLMTAEQMATFRCAMGVPEGLEWDRFAGLDLAPDRLAAFLREVPFGRSGPRTLTYEPVAVPERLAVSITSPMSTREGFGRILGELARGDTALARRIVTTSADVTISTNLGGWVNRRGIFDRRRHPDPFRELQVNSVQSWSVSPEGQHFELGIAEHNLFLMLAAMGLAGPLFGVPLLPVGTVYDPFIMRGLDALTYACYQNARFLVAGTPSGISLAPEGGAHQSVTTPLIGLGLPGLTAFEPGYVDELATILRWAFDHLQRPDGGPVYLRLSTRPLVQPVRTMDDRLRTDILSGGYWRIPPVPGAELAIVYAGAVAADAAEAHAQVLEDIPGAGLLAVTSYERLHAGWAHSIRPGPEGRTGTPPHIARLLEALPPSAALVTVIDGHPAALSWLGAVQGHRVYPLGVTRFGQSGTIPELYRACGIDAEAILDAVAMARSERIGGRGAHQ